MAKVISVKTVARVVKTKGNPASHRMMNANLKARRQACWLRSEKRKAARRIAQEEAHRRNVERGYSEWDLVKERRANARRF